MNLDFWLKPKPFIFGVSGEVIYYNGEDQGRHVLEVRGRESRILLALGCLLNIFVEMEASPWLCEFRGRRAPPPGSFFLSGDETSFET